MTRKMRRSAQALSMEETRLILERRTSGVLAVNGTDGYPYAVPLSFVFDDDRIYFHSAVSGSKLDALAHDDRVSFCVIDEDDVIADEYTTYFRSAIVFGQAKILMKDEDIRRALDLLGRKYAPGHAQSRRDDAINKELKLVTVIELTIEEMTGKEAIELIRAKQAK